MQSSFMLSCIARYWSMYSQGKYKFYYSSGMSFSVAVDAENDLFQSPTSPSFARTWCTNIHSWIENVIVVKKRVRWSIYDISARMILTLHTLSWNLSHFAFSRLLSLFVAINDNPWYIFPLFNQRVFENRIVMWAFWEMLHRSQIAGFLSLRHRTDGKYDY